MDIKKRGRTELKSFFVKNAIPTEGNFKDLIEGMINQPDDGIVKLAGEPLSLQADGNATSQKKVINFYKDFNDPKPAWILSVGPLGPGDTAPAQPGWSVGDADGNSRLFIDENSGNLGVGTTRPVSKLDVMGDIALQGKSALGSDDAWLQLNQDGKFSSGVRTPGLFVPDSLNVGGVAGNANPGAGNVWVKGTVGIGTNTPVSKLDVMGNISLQGRLALGSDDAWLQLNQDGQFRFGVRTPGLFAPDSLNVGGVEGQPGAGNVWVLGKVGIGTNQPQNELDIMGDIAIGNKHAIRGDSQWLRLNEEGDFSLGVRTQGLFLPDSLNVGGIVGESNPGAGNVWVSGNAWVAGKVGIGFGMREPKKELDINGEIAIAGIPAICGEAGQWLSLNQERKFVSGVHTPGLFVSNSLNVGGLSQEGNPGAGNVWVKGSVGIGTPDLGHKLSILLQDQGDGILLDSGDSGKAVALFTNNTQGAWNGLTHPGDHLLLWKGKDVDDPGAGLVIAPWRNSAKGIRIDANGNVGIGTFDPKATLDVNGMARIASVSTADKDPDSGMTYGGSLVIKSNSPQIDFIDTEHSDWSIHVSGNKMFFIRQPWESDLVLDGAGSVGIGTETPKGKLEVNGVAVISNGHSVAAGAGFMVSGSLTLGGVNTNYGGGQGATSNIAGLLLETVANTEIAVHDANSRFASLMYYEGDAAHRITIGRNMGWGPIGQVVLNGCVGIGTETPKGKLEVIGVAVISDGASGAARDGRMAPGSLTLGGTNASYGGGEGQRATNTAGLLFETAANTEIAVHDAGSRFASLMYYEGDAANRITIGRDMGWGAIGQVVLYGSVGIGTTASPANKLQLAGNLHMDGNPIFLRQDPQDQFDVIKWNKTTDQVDIAGFHGVCLGYTEGGQMGDAVTSVLTVSSQGVWTPSGVFSGSDLRMKAEVAPLKQAPEKLLKLRGVQFKWRDSRETEPRVIGLIAQEVEKVFPEVVATGPDGMKGINYSALIAVLIETVKDQQSQISGLAARMESLQAG